MKNKSFYSIESLIEYTKFAIPALICVGAFQLYIFYGSFGINFFNFVNFSELLFVFLSGFFSNYLWLIIMVGYSILTEDRQMRSDNTALYQQILDSNNLQQRVLLYLNRMWPLLILMLLLPTTAFILEFTEKKPHNSSFNLLGFSILVLIYVVSTYELPRPFQKNLINENDYIKKRFIFNTMLIVAFLTNIAHGKAIGIKYDKKTYGTEFYFENNKILKSDSLNYYIGQTTDYIFYYHQKDDYCEVYPKSEIKKIVFVNK